MDLKKVSSSTRELVDLSESLLKIVVKENVAGAAGASIHSFQEVDLVSLVGASHVPLLLVERREWNWESFSVLI